MHCVQLIIIIPIPPFHRYATVKSVHPAAAAATSAYNRRNRTIRISAFTAGFQAVGCAHILYTESESLCVRCGCDFFCRFLHSFCETCKYLISPKFRSFYHWCRYFWLIIALIVPNWSNSDIRYKVAGKKSIPWPDKILKWTLTHITGVWAVTLWFFTRCNHNGRFHWNLLIYCIDNFYKNSSEHHGYN